MKFVHFILFLAISLYLSAGHARSSSEFRECIRVVGNQLIDIEPGLQPEEYIALRDGFQRAVGTSPRESSTRKGVMRWVWNQGYSEDQFYFEHRHKKTDTRGMSLGYPLTLLAKIALAAEECGYLNRSNRAGANIDHPRWITRIFISDLERSCHSNAIFASWGTPCSSLAFEAGKLLAIRRYGIPFSIGYFDGGGGLIENLVMQTPALDQKIGDFITYLHQIWDGTPISSLRFPKPDSEVSEKMRNLDLWNTLLRSAGIDEVSQIEPEQRKQLLVTLALFTEADVNLRELHRSFLTQRNYERYANLMETLRGPTSAIPLLIAYHEMRTTFGIEMPDEFRGYHAISAALRGCVLRERGYRIEEITEVSHLTGMLYELYSYVTHGFHRAIRDTAMSYVGLYGWLEQASEAATNDALKHRIGGEFGAKLCNPL